MKTKTRKLISQKLKRHYLNKKIKFWVWGTLAFVTIILILGWAGNGEYHSLYL